MSVLFRPIRSLPRVSGVVSRQRAFSNGNRDPPAGSIRGGGGKFSEIEAAEENVYFKKLEREQLRKLKAMKEETADHVQEEISGLEERVSSLKKKLKEQKKEINNLEKKTN